MLVSRWLPARLRRAVALALQSGCNGYCQRGRRTGVPGSCQAGAGHRGGGHAGGISGRRGLHRADAAGAERAVLLRHHFQQNFHVRHRLDRYRAGRCLEYGDLDPDVLAAAIAEEIGRPVSYRPVETEGAARAAACLAELV